MPTLQEKEVFADRYLLRSMLGAHGISEVWLAEDVEDTGAQVALKVYTPQFRLDGQVLRLLRDDYLQVSELDHPHLLHFHRFDTYQSIPYLVLPYLENGSLARQLYDKGPLTPYEIALLLQQAGSGLQYLHSQQPPVLHQSIRPENILLADDDSYLLADYGISSRTRALLRRATGLESSLPVAYAAPELFAAQPVSHPSGDIFALGVTLYELCTGQVPWQGNGGLALLQGAEVPILPGSFDRVLSNIVRACLDPNWEKRPTAAELEAEGTYFLEHNKWKTYGKFGVVTANVIEYKPTPRYKRALVGLVVLLALAALGYFYYTRYYLPGKTGQAVEHKVITVTPPQPDTGRDSGTLSAAAAEDSAQALPAEPAAAGTRPAPPKAASTNPATATTRNTTPEAGSATTRKPAFSKPRSLSAFISRMVDENVPFEVRERWKPDMLKLFAPDAAVYYGEGDVDLGRLSAGEFVDILLSTDSTSTVTVDSTLEDDAGKVRELHVRVQSGD